MKKWLMAALIGVLLLTAPFVWENEGGNQTVGALAWKAVHWQESGQWRVYLFPDSLQGVDNLIKIEEERIS